MIRRKSLPILLQQRSLGHSHRHVFHRQVACLRQETMGLLEEPRIASPHRGSITALDIDLAEDRFLLAGGSDAVVSLYDMSPWGMEQHQGSTLRHTSAIRPASVHAPVGQSIRVPEETGNNTEDVPSGHSHSIIAAQWYPVDTGAFVSASAEGSILVWDTNRLTPVIRWKPLETCRCIDMQRRGGSFLLAVGSIRSNSVRLVDLRSGASAHSLVGHNDGITVTKWSPNCPTVLASGGLDGTIRLWDIRKSGSNACLTVLDRDRQEDGTASKGYLPNYDNLKHTNLKHTNTRNEKRPSSSRAAPSNYHRAQSIAVASHGGAISSLAFTSDGHSLVSTGRDGRLQQWDLRTSGCLVPVHFWSASNQPAVSKGSKVPLLATQSTGQSTSVVVGFGKRLLKYSLQRGGKPTQVLEGHLDNITSVASQDGWMRLLTGGKDGMILVWGYKPSSLHRKRNAANRNENHHQESKRVRQSTDEDRDAW